MLQKENPSRVSVNYFVSMAAPPPKRRMRIAIPSSKNVGVVEPVTGILVGDAALTAVELVGVGVATVVPPVPETETVKVDVAVSVVPVALSPVTVTV